MKAFVAVTDNDWFRFLRDRPELDEVNFWQPSGSNRFRALSRGEPFLFKLHSPHDFIVGGGFFAHFSILPHRTAWEFFGEKNGASTLGEMRARIERYRRTEPDPFEDYEIGCIILVEPFFFDEDDWIPVPEDWSPNIVRGKGYDLTESLGAELWERVQLRLRAHEIGSSSSRRDLQLLEAPSSEQGSLYGDPVLTRRRLGQGSFRALITDTYRRRCAVTREKALPVLEAAHIQPVSEGGQHLVDNGLLLRSDIHRLFDRGYVTVTPDYRFRVSSRLRDDFDNGEPYYPLDSNEIWVPPDTPEKPRREFLEWHADEVFRS